MSRSKSWEQQPHHRFRFRHWIMGGVSRHDGPAGGTRSAHGARKRRLQLEPLEDRRVLTGDLVISEFMASNNDTIDDSFGESSDWIEIFNDGSNAIDLNGYFLTDDALHLTKWEFPAYSLAPGQAIVVFASSRDVNLPNGEMHTNFRLSASGEYLALVDQDGTTVIHDYGPTYPPQFEDVSYGMSMHLTGATRPLVNSGDTLSAYEPINDILGLTWTLPDFNDSTWPITGPSPVGYERTPGDYAGLIQTPLPDNARSLYLRHEFEISSLHDVAALDLAVRYDDGYVAYLNGVRIASANVPDSVSWNSFAAANHPDDQAVVPEVAEANRGVHGLRVGQNVLAIHGMNVSDTSSDLLIGAQLTGKAATVTQPATLGFRNSATPGSVNSDAFDGYNTPVTFSLPHGFYSTAQALTLTTTVPDDIIVYTLDGSEPAVDANFNITNGQLYTGPLIVNRSSVVRAASFQDGYRPVPSVTQSYLFLDDVLQQSPNGQPPAGWPDSGVNEQELDYGMDPTIIAQYGSQAIQDALTEISTFSISTDLDHLFDPQTGIYVNANNGGRSWERPASVELIGAEGDGGFQINAGLRIRGGYSRNDFNPKHAFRFYFRSEYGASKLNFPLFGDEGTDEFDVLDLRTAQNYSWSSSGDSQNTFVREVFSRDLQKDLGHEYTRSRYHHLYINGVYWGLFQTQERVNDAFGETYFGGEKEDYDVVKAGLRTTGGPTEIADGNEEAWLDLFQLAQDLSDNPTANASNYFTMQGLNPDGTRNFGLPVLVDMKNLIEYNLILFYTGNLDSGLSVFVGNQVANNWVGLRNRLNQDDGFVFFAHDAEHSLGVANTEFVDRTGPFNEGFQDDPAYSNPQFLHQDLLASPEYRLAFADRVHALMFNNGPLTPSQNANRLNKRVAVVDDVIIAESARWGDSKTATPFDKQDWQTEINTIVPYFNIRGLPVVNQLANDGLYPSLAPPTLNQFGGAVASGFQATLTAPNGTIYYTTDGSDPREFGGTIANTASIYGNTPITISEDTVVKARTRQSGEWSALIEAKFTLLAAPAESSSLRVTELNFNPADPTAVELAINASLDNDDFEFIEFQNVSDGPIDVGDVIVDIGTPFALPATTVQPGEFVLVVANQAAFELRYGPSHTVLAETGLSRLSNSGDTVTILASDASIIQSFTYDDNDNWPSYADGHGETMRIIDRFGDYSDPLNWLPSRFSGGTPGSAEPVVYSSSPLRVTEIMYNPSAGTGSEFIELQNTGAAPLSLLGYHFVEGVEFDFSLSESHTLGPGERAVMVADLAEFTGIYGGQVAVLGSFSSGSLSNGGERLILVDPNRNPVHDFVYDDGLPWPTSPDGGGTSLTVIDTDGDYSDAANWRPSTVLGGTPGLPNAPRGDFNDDGLWDCADIDQLTSNVASGSNDGQYDMDADGLVTEADTAAWLVAGGAMNPSDTGGNPFLVGDANLDGSVDGSDFLIWNDHKFSGTSDWCQANFDGNAFVDGRDFLIWNANKFQSSVAIPTANRISQPVHNHLAVANRHAIQAHPEETTGTMETAPSQQAAMLHPSHGSPHVPRETGSADDGQIAVRLKAIDTIFGSGWIGMRWHEGG